MDRVSVPEGDLEWSVDTVHCTSVVVVGLDPSYNWTANWIDSRLRLSVVLLSTSLSVGWMEVKR